MFAVVKYGNQQYKVSPEQTLKIDKLNLEEGKTFKTDEVLLVSDKNVEIGTPFVSGMICEAKVIKHTKAPKVLVYKKKSKKRYERTQGHRQDYTEIQIITIGKGTATKTTAKTEEAKPEEPVKKEAKVKAPAVKKATPKKKAPAKKTVKK